MPAVSVQQRREEMLQRSANEPDIPLANEPEERGYHSDDSRNFQDAEDAGSDDEGEDLQDNAERCQQSCACQLNAENFARQNAQLKMRNCILCVRGKAA